MAQGMFDSIRNLQNGMRQEDVDEQRRLQFMAADPARARALSSYEMAGMAGRGLGQAATALAGNDPRTSNERQLDSMKAAQAAMSELGEPDFTTPAGVDSYYKGVIGILRQNNLPGEAHAAALEWNDYKNKTADRKIKEDDLKRKQTADAAKAATEQAKVAAAAERNRLMAQRGMGEFVGWVDRIEKTEDPRTKEILLARANAEIAAKNRSGKKITLENAGDRIIVRDETGAILGTDEMGEKPLSAKDSQKKQDALEAVGPAYRTDMLNLQTVYKAAVDLYNSRGLDDLIGKWTGIAAETGAEKGGALREMAIARLGKDGQEALGLFQQIQGATFIKALKDLKQASKTGSTGLGAVSEVEGNKIQAAAASLFPRQQPESFRRKLADFVSTIEETANILAEKADKDGISPIHLNTVPMVGARGARPAPAPTTPAAQNPASTNEVRVMAPDGLTTGRIPRSRLDFYKSQGFKEVK